MKKFLVLTVIAAMLVAPFAAARADAPFEIGIILPLTGPATFVGAPQREAFEALEAYVNQTGGIQGQPIKFVFKDDGTNPATAVQLANQLATQQPPAILGPGIVAACSATVPVLAHGPVEYCLSPALHPAAGSNAFSSNVSTSDLLAASVRFFRDRGLRRIAIFTSTDATGQDADNTLADVFARPENKVMQVVAREHFAPSDLSVAAQIAHIKAANPQLLLTWTTGTPVATILRGAHEAGLDIPVYTTTSNATYVQMREYASFLPTTLYFPGPAGMATGSTGDRATDAAIKIFSDSLAKNNEKVLYAHTTAWDPGLILISALRKLGTHATPDQVRDYIANLQGFVGVNGRYDFKKYPQRGLGKEAAFMTQWDPKKQAFVIVSRSGGAPL
jgi:branched-chain amino acid transport system substrate-binding protein